MHPGKQLCVVGLTKCYTCIGYLQVALPDPPLMLILLAWPVLPKLVNAGLQDLQQRYVRPTWTSTTFECIRLYSQQLSSLHLSGFAVTESAAVAVTADSNAAFDTAVTHYGLLCRRWQKPMQRSMSP